MARYDKAQRQIEWFLERGFQLGQDKKRFYLTHPAWDTPVKFDSIEDARKFVDVADFIGFNKRWHTEMGTP